LIEVHSQKILSSLLVELPDDKMKRARCIDIYNTGLRKAEPLTQKPGADGPLTGVATRGAGIFEHNCQACHGAGAVGGMGPKLVKSPILKHEESFRETIVHGRGAMPAWGPVLSRQDIADIYAWLLVR